MARWAVIIWGSALGLITWAALNMGWVSEQGARGGIGFAIGVVCGAWLVAPTLKDHP